MGDDVVVFVLTEALRCHPGGQGDHQCTTIRQQPIGQHLMLTSFGHLSSVPATILRTYNRTRSMATTLEHAGCALLETPCEASDESTPLIVCSPTLRARSELPRRCLADRQLPHRL